MKASLSHDGQEIHVSGRVRREPGAVVLRALDAEQSIWAAMTPDEADQLADALHEAAAAARGVLDGEVPG